MGDSSAEEPTELNLSCGNIHFSLRSRFVVGVLQLEGECTAP